MSSGDASTRAPQVPTNSKLLALSQRGVSPRASAPYGDQEPSVAPTLPIVEKQHQAPEILRCQQCPLLEKEAHRLRKQLGAVHTASPTRSANCLPMRVSCRGHLHMELESQHSGEPSTKGSRPFEVSVPLATALPTLLTLQEARPRPDSVLPDKLDPASL